MAIQGFYSTGGGSVSAPYVAAHIDFGRLGITQEILFLVDTGSYRTCLHPFETARLGINYQELDRRTLIQSSGIGGSAGYYLEPAWLMFNESTGGYVFCQLEMAIIEQTDDPAIGDLPSLLGRDFLNRCRVFLDSEMNIVQMEPRNVSGGLVLA